ncbi:AAA family ATPase [Limisphaera ngatamarikiensis]|uniref:AAA family ATPase n=1 Tax=Limisphaera ngatamarikiensis TaxID=1324935 RepID=A0A6M1RMX4_9BACT|nr:AAA family ATPase [Limisphaera ngatamarikiensis]NGO39043.1 AAA family ATPase [Limisphaera ngatamarikiensis]
MRQAWGVALHPVLQEKLTAGLEPVSVEGWTRRDTRLPAIRNKVHTGLGMRRVGKTTFLRQLQQEQQQALGPQRAVYLSFDDDRLADLSLSQLDALLEEYYRTFPEFRNYPLILTDAPKGPSLSHTLVLPSRLRCPPEKVAEPT